MNLFGYGWINWLYDRLKMMFLVFLIVCFLCFVFFGVVCGVVWVGVGVVCAFVLYMMVGLEFEFMVFIELFIVVVVL